MEDTKEKRFVGLDGLKHFWTKAKTWIMGQITAEVTAKIAEIVANAPEDLDTLKEIADWIKTHANDASAMNTAILANTEAISEKADKIHTHTKSEITDFPTSLPANGGTATKATTADFAKNMYPQVFDLTSLDKTKFYPLVCSSSYCFAEVAIFSEGGGHTLEYNQNRIHFDISTFGWRDTPFSLNIREYACFDNEEITIGCIGRGTHYGDWALWLRGGVRYICYSRSSDLSLKTSDYTYVDEIYTVGTNYYGGANSNVSIVFTPQSTITDGAYSNRPITAPNITSLEERVAALESKV